MKHWSSQTTRSHFPRGLWSFADTMSRARIHDSVAEWRQSRTCSLDWHACQLFLISLAKRKCKRKPSENPPALSLSFTYNNEIAEFLLERPRSAPAFAVTKILGQFRTVFTVADLENELRSLWMPHQLRKTAFFGFCIRTCCVDVEVFGCRVINGTEYFLLGKLRRFLSRTQFLLFLMVQLERPSCLVANYVMFFQPVLRIHPIWRSPVAP